MITGWRFWSFAEMRMNLHADKVRWQMAEVLSHFGRHSLSHSASS